MSKEQTFILDFDDFGSLTPGEVQLEKLKEHYPDLKVTLFTVPFDLSYLLKKADIEKLKEWGKIVEKRKDWMEIALHGFLHIKAECMVDRKQATTLIKASENILDKIGLSYVKIFKAPHWQMSPEFEQVLLERGYVKAIDRNNPEVHTNIPTYMWTWDMKDPVPNWHTVKGHGHVLSVYGGGYNANGIDKCLPNLLTIPTNAKFQFVSEYLEENGISTERHNSS